MRRSSWIMLALCGVIVVFLAAAYVATQAEPETLTEPQAVAMLDTMRDALQKKSVEGIMKYITPSTDPTFAGVSPEKLRAMLANLYRNGGDIQASYTNVTFASGADESLLTFDAIVKNTSQFASSEDFNQRVTLHLKKVEVPRMFGLFHGKEWRVVGADTNGTKLNELGDY